jgi:hypothetical protein
LRDPRLKIETRGKPGQAWGTLLNCPQVQWDPGHTSQLSLRLN